MNLNNIIAYFRDCYRADTRTLSITNTFSKKVENRLVIEGNDEILNGNLKEYPVSWDYAWAVEKNLSLYITEKVFYCCAFSIIGRQEELKLRDSKLCAPLFLYPAKIIKREEHHFVSIDLDKRIININFLNTIKKLETTDLYESILNIDPVISDLGTIGNLQRTLSKRLQDFQAEDLLMYPALSSEKQLKRMLQPKQLDKIDGFKIVPSITFGVFKRSTHTQGILSELSKMSEQSDFSTTLQYLFEKKTPSFNETLEIGYVPAVLSDAQNNVLTTVNQHHTSLVIGPPGTGKSFTIASLALDFLSKGKSVLIASKTDQAVDVILKKIEYDLNMKGLAFRAGRSNYRKSLKDQLEGKIYRPGGKLEGRIEKIDSKKDELRKLDREEQDDSAQFDLQISNELKWGKFVSQYSYRNNLLRKLQLRYIAWKNKKQLPHWVITQKFLEDSSKRMKLIKKLIRMTFEYQFDRALFKSREMYRLFFRSLSSRNSSRKEEFFSKIDLDLLLDTLPIWLVNMADIHSLFPLRKEVFDLAIIDEATQCDIASSIPILQRAKRVVIVGDPQQLRHISFLSRSAQSTLLRKNKIDASGDDPRFDYRNISILDLVNDRIIDQNQVCFLDEHFRSSPELIRFSNGHFYGDKLRIMTNAPQIKKSEPFQIIESNGERVKGVNEKEAQDIIQYITKTIERQKHLDNYAAQTIGVLSPFREQVDRLTDLLVEKIDLFAIEKHQIKCGTAYAFQGEERDIVLISWAIDDQSHHSAIIHLNKPEVFNVSITRAKSKQVLFKSFTKNKFRDSYLVKYLSQIQSDLSKVDDTFQATRDEFLLDVKERISAMKWDYWMNYKVAGVLLDILYRKEGRIYGINLIGYPGQFVDALGLEDYKILVRTGIKVFPLPYTYWTFDRENCFNELLAFSNP